MIKNNLFGQILIGIIALFLIIGSIQMFGIGTGIDSIEVDPENTVKLPSIPKGKNNEGEVEQDSVKKMIGDIGGTPMFSLTREPFQEPEDSIDLDEPDPTQPTINELKAQLTGVVITPTESYAMIFDALTSQRETYRVGMPLDGEQGGWTLDSIQSRKVVFVSEDDRVEELELEVFSGNMNAGGNTKSKDLAKTSNVTEAMKKQEKKRNAEDIRQKIAERRAQMRAEAAAKNNQK